MPTMEGSRTNESRLGRSLAVGLVIGVLLAAISLIDEATGLFHLTVLYAIPIIMATWAFGLLGGLATGGLAIAAVAVTHSLLHSPTLVADIATDVVVFVFAAVVVDRLRAQLRTITALEARRDFDLGIASEVQTSMLSPWPDDARFEIASALHFVREVGGDYYRFARVGEKLYLFAGDISGKGMSAALFAVLLDEAIGDALEVPDPLESQVELVNRRMYARMPPEMFVTMLFAALDDDGISFVNAAHVRPLLFVAAEQRTVELADAGTLPLGIEPSIPAQSARVLLERGDTLLVCSDGVTESPRLLHESSLLADTFAQTAPRGPQAVVDEIAALAESRGQTDDVTVICMRRR